MIRVAITTDRFETAAPPFSRLGMEPVPAPCVKVERGEETALAQARKAAAAADLLLLTSVRTLDLLWPDRSMPAVPVAAVGVATAASAQARGGRVVVSGRSGLADLATRASALLAAPVVVFPHASGSDPVAMQRLRELAQGLQEFEVYRTVPVAPPPAAVEAVAFASPSAVEGWLLSRDMEGLVVGAIGPTTGEAVARLRPPDVVASPPSHVALARALASYLEVSR